MASDDSNAPKVTQLNVVESRLNTGLPGPQAQALSHYAIPVCTKKYVHVK